MNTIYFIFHVAFMKNEIGFNVIMQIMSIRPHVIDTIKHFEEIKKRHLRRIENSIRGTYKNTCSSIDRTWHVEIESREKWTVPIPVVIANKDTFDYAGGLISADANARVIILNMASEKEPGGGWRRNGNAQEESLFFRSTYSIALEANQKFYPVAPDEVIYTPDIYVFKDLRNRLYPWELCFWVSGIAAAAVRTPLLTDDGEYVNEEDKITMKNKMHAMIQLAVIQGYTDIVLSAFGCGAFRNNPYTVSTLFKEVIRSGQYTSYIRIHFAIKGVENFNIFSETLNGL